MLAAHTIPMVLLLLWGGVISDRFPRALVLQLSNVASAITQGLIAFLVLTGSAELWMLIALSRRARRGLGDLVPGDGEPAPPARASATSCSRPTR